MSHGNNGNGGNEQAIVDELLALEHRRGRALVDKDFEALAQLVSQDVVHVHTRGNVDTFDSYMHYVRNVLEFLDVERSDMHVKVLGDTAIMTGGQVNTARLIGHEDVVRVTSRVIQVWMRQAQGGWQQVAFQATPVGAPPPVVNRLMAKPRQ